MNTYTEFAEKMLLALYQESERTEKDYYTFGELIDRYGIEAKEPWIQRLADEWEHGYAREVVRFLGGSAREWNVRISGEGMRYVEDRFGGKDGIGEILEPVSEGATLEPFLQDAESQVGEAPFDPNVFDPKVFDTGDLPARDDLIHSSAWTGITTQVISSRNADQVRIAVLKAKDVVRDLGSNEKTSQALAYLAAAEALIEAPEPPSDLIWELIGRAGAICGVIGLFLTLFVIG